VALGAGAIIIMGTPAGAAALSPGDASDCGVDGIGRRPVTIGAPR
jgi:fumarylpyruvate hydrolase